MVTQTISLTSIPSKKPKCFKGLLVNQYYENRLLYTARQVHYDNQKEYMDKYFSDWLIESNEKLITDLDSFIDSSLGLNVEELLFDNHCSDQIQATTLVLGMHASDHLPTLNLLEEHIRQKYQTIHIIRIEPHTTKRSQLVNLRVQLSNEHKHVLVLVQQLETTEPALVQTLVHIFHDLLQESEDNKVMLLFCMSGNWNTIAQILPSGYDNRLEIKDPILKDTRKVSQSIQSKLLEIKDIPMRIGPKLLELLFVAFNERDPSIANVQYMINFILHQYNFKRPSYLTMKKGDLVQLLNRQKKLVGDIQKLESLEECDPNEIDKVNWNDSLDVATFCKRHIKLLMEHNEFVFAEMEYYFKLLRDETRQSFPTNLFDIYEELIDHDELAHSAKFMDAISNIAKYSTEGLIRRIDLCLISEKEKSDKSVLRVIGKFREKLYNNENRQEITLKLVSQLHKHAQLLKNPSRMAFNEAIFYDDFPAVRRATMPSTRFACLNHYLNETTYHGVLYSIINSSPEDINIQDLFDVFQVSVEKMKRTESRPSILSVGSNAIKTKTSKRLRQTTANELTSKTSNHTTPTIDDRLLKAVFLDLIHSMERQGLIKYHSTLSRPNMIRRCVWL